MRQRIRNLLLAQGYQQVFQRVSRFDDWYLLTSN